MDPYLSPTSESSTGSIYLQQHPFRCGQCKRQLQVTPGENVEAIFPCCTNCRKAFYCSTSHRKAHMSKHTKAGCFPAVILSSPTCGRYWVASRDIAMDEVIFTDKALVIAPNVGSVSPMYYPTCLGCARGTNTSYRCSRCGWPMCNKRCEKIPNHSQNECKIFRKNRIESNCRPQYYFFVQFLRTLLLRENDPNGFAQLMELEAHVKSRRQVKEEVFMLKSFYKFLTEDCNMSYEYDLVDRVVGINRVNCYSADGLIDGKKRFCSAVFPNLSLINHSCRPNTRIVMHEKPGGILLIELRACVQIRQGEEISQQYVSSTKGTFQRQQILSEDWFFQCLCERCRDPTEFDTFFSAIKCVNCAEGYLLPKDPVQLDSTWDCINIIAGETDDCNHIIEPGCGYSRTSENVKCLIDDMDRQAKQAAYNTKALERLLGEFSLHSLHPNHYLVVNIKFGIVDDIVRKINYYPSQQRSSDLVEYEQILKAVKYTKDILAVTRVICPGRSYCIGILLFFLASCLLELRTRNVSCKFTDTQVENVIKEAVAILQVEAVGTTYRDMTTLLEERSLILNMNSLSF